MGLATASRRQRHSQGIGDTFGLHRRAELPGDYVSRALVGQLATSCGLRSPSFMRFSGLENRSDNAAKVVLAAQVQNLFTAAGGLLLGWLRAAPTSYWPTRVYRRSDGMRPSVETGSTDTKVLVWLTHISRYLCMLENPESSNRSPVDRLSLNTPSISKMKITKDVSLNRTSLQVRDPLFRR